MSFTSIDEGEARCLFNHGTPVDATSMSQFETVGLVFASQIETDAATASVFAE